MKKLIIPALAIFLSGASVSAQVVDTTQSYQQAGRVDNPGQLKSQQDGDFTKIKSDELPDAVKRSLQGTQYNNWNVSSAYRNGNTNQYRIEMRNGSQSKIYLFDNAGKRLGDGSDATRPNPPTTPAPGATTPTNPGVPNNPNNPTNPPTPGNPPTPEN